MTHHVRGALDRLFAHSVLWVVALVCVAAPLAAQEATGKIEGTVTDQAGAPIANAQVTIVGTAFGALTSEKGYYFINSVPAASYTLRAKFIGFAAAEVPVVRILAGQTVTQNIKLTQAAVGIAGLVIEAAANPIVPRDQVTSKTTMTSADLQNLPVEDLRSVIDLQPGVVESGKGRGVSIRGGRPGEAATYVDGVLVRNTQRGRSALQIGSNAVEEVSVTTGALSAQFGEAQSGVIAVATKAGTQRFQGAMLYQSDDVGLWQNVGYNRLEASISGPILHRLTFFLGTTLTGQKSEDSPIGSDNDRPIFVTNGVDTTVRQPSSVGAPLTDSTTIAIPKFVQYNGTCGQYGAAAAPATGSTTAQQMRDNYGVSCQGIRTPFSGSGNNTATAKLFYSYGNGSSLSFTGLGSWLYARNLPITADSVNPPSSNLYNPVGYTGSTNRSFAGILNWSQNLARSSERAMAVDVHLSYQADQNISGQLTRQSELDSRDAFGGFMFKPLNYLIDFNSTHDVRIKDSTYTGVHYLDARQIQCVQAGEGACQNDVPFLNANDINSVMPYRMNPYGVEQSTRFPLWLAGASDAINEINLQKETRLIGTANFDWQADRYNRINVGGEYVSFNTSRYDSPFGQNTAFALSSYHEKPQRMGAFVQDRLDLGDVVIVGGVRYDQFNSNASFPFTPGRISSLPVMPSETICGPDGTCGAIPNSTQPFNPYDPTASYVAAPSHSTFSPRVQVSFPVSENTNFRLSYSQQVQVPEFDLMFRGINTDLSVTNRNQTYGRDLDFAKTIIFEFGIRHAFNQDMVLDVSAYNKDKLSDIAARLYQLPDPKLGLSNAGPNVYTTGDFRVLTNADFGNVRGVDVRLDRRFSNLFSGAISYTLQFAKNTGSDPFSYTTLLGRQISSLTGTTSPPPQALLPTDDNRQHNIVGSASLQFPGNWHKGSVVGGILRNAGAFVTFRFASGLPYTLVQPQESGVNIITRCGLECNLQEPINTSTLPWYRNVDLRVTKGVQIRRSQWTLFAEAKNLLNWTNVMNLFTEVGSVLYPKYQAKYVDEQVSLLASEAKAAGILNPADSSVNFLALGGCQNWAGTNTTNFASGPVDCVLLERAEARYGNGDGIFSPSEYTAAFNAWYNLANAPSIFYGTGRRLRIGAQLTF